MRNLPLIAAVGITILFSNFGYAASNSLQMAIATCQVDAVERLLKEGSDPNAKDGQGRPIFFWMASNRKCSDDSALATAKLLDAHGAKFESLEGSNPSLLTNLAHRSMPHTVAFIAQKKGTGDPTEALHAIARRGDLESVRALLSAGADPLVGEARTSALFDATAEGHTDSVREMLKHAKDKQSPKVVAAYEIAKLKGSHEMAQAFLDAGMKPVAEPVRKENPCRRRELTDSQTLLMKQLKIPNAHGLSGLAGSMTCKLVQECGDLFLVDCNSAADGPAYYINRKTNQLLATCGGACMRGCKDECPPKAWTCECKL